jgi:hypothetical protein
MKYLKRSIIQMLWILLASFILAVFFGSVTELFIRLQRLFA